EISGESVTLDLGGFSIIGPVGCTGIAATCPTAGTGIGVQAAGNRTSGARNVRVTNGSVHGMGSIGIQITGLGGMVEGVRSYNNAGGGIIAGMVTDSTATQNGSFGILATAVKGSTSSENAADGIILNGEGGVAVGNVSSSNGGVGIVAPYGTVTNNSLFL